MITQGELKYQVIGNKEDGFMRVWLRDVNRHFFDALHGKESMHLDDDTNEYYHIKIVRHRGTEIWLTCHEDKNGNRYGVLDPEAPSSATSRLPDGGANLPALVALVEGGAPEQGDSQKVVGTRRYEVDYGIENNYGCTKRDQVTDMTETNGVLVEQMTRVGVQYERTDLNMRTAITAESCYLVHYTSPKTSAPMTILVVPQTGLDSWAESYFYFPGMVVEDANKLDWPQVYEHIKALDLWAREGTP